MNTPYDVGLSQDISLEPVALPGYAVRTVLRMFIALLFSLIFTLIVAPIAAKNKQAEKIIIPFIDIMQSIPILGFLSITIVAFIKLFPNSLLGPECAAIFAVFTSQVWNMTLSFYQSLRMMPKDLYDTAAIFHLTTWQQFWRIELPKATPGLLWNAMISLSGGWFFVVASEAISVSNQQILLPGIGSYIFVAIKEANLTAVGYAIFTMFIVILLYDQLLFRPLLTWAERFKPEKSEEESLYHSWFYSLIMKTRWFKNFKLRSIPDIIFTQTQKLLPHPFNFLKSSQLNSQISRIQRMSLNKFSENHFSKWSEIAIITWNSLLILGSLIASFFLLQFVLQTITFQEVRHVFFLGAITGLKVALLVVLASLIWIPVGVYIGFQPKLRLFFQPLIQFIAAFPVNLIYPIVVTLIVYYQLNVNIWSAPLMILGTQWYILFNVIAATSTIPNELRLVTQNFSLSAWLKWKRLILPAIFPYYITGAMAAAAGSWNASIVADVLSWGDHHLVAVGLGSYIAEYTSVGDFPRIALGIFVMCCYVLLINRIVWSNLYRIAATRFVLE